jgi:hypothetical protein
MHLYRITTALRTFLGLNPIPDDGPVGRLLQGPGRHTPTDLRGGGVPGPRRAAGRTQPPDGTGYARGRPGGRRPVTTRSGWSVHPGHADGGGAAPDDGPGQQRADQAHAGGDECGDVCTGEERDCCRWAR